jgi:hypothetical protein
MRLGLEQAMRRGDAEDLSRRLDALWQAVFKAPPRDLDHDLELLRRFFHPAAQGHRLRNELTDLPPAPEEALPLAPQLAVAVDEERRLITPEGRVALGLLRRALADDVETILLRDDQLLDAESRLLLLYSDWSRHRINQVLALMSGRDKPLQVPAIGILLTLLVARATSPERAIVRGGDDRDRREVESALFAAADAFASKILPSSKRRMGKETLIGGWTIGEVARRIPAAVSADDERVFISPGHESEALDLASRELADRVDTAAVAEAFDALVATLRQNLPTLAAHHLAFERAPDTRRLRQTLLDSVDRAAAGAGAGTL